ncbi:anthranilate phosphoribosyltransferase [bacterium]|nr:anthranilate phosphoribosyltransferase [bacterium]
MRFADNEEFFRAMSLTQDRAKLLAAPENTDLDSLRRILEELKSSIKTDLSDLGRDALDCCGTGGSGHNKLNTSTAVAFVVAAAGKRVIKFGNRSATGQSGSLDFLDSISIAPLAERFAIEQSLAKENLAFLDATRFYPQLKELAPIRKNLGRPTILNFLGPLLNPLKPEYRLLGVSNETMLNDLATICIEDQTLTKALLVRSEKGLDELDPVSSNTVIEINSIETPIRYRMKTLRISGPICVERRDNRSIFLDIIDGKDSKSLAYATLVLNAAAALLAAAVADSLEEGMETVETLLKSGAVKQKYLRFRELTKEIAA